MRNIHVGLDFGTSQTKVCLHDLDSSNYEFLYFDNGTPFLPSVVNLRNDQKFSYGIYDDPDTDKQFTYFKIAAAEDKEFRKVSNEEGSVGLYTHMTEFANFPPEFLSVIYVTYVILYIELYVRRVSGNTSRATGMASRIIKKAEAHSAKFTYRMGVPTEWTKAVNLYRKRKFENILLHSVQLARHYETLEVYQNASMVDLIRQINEELDKRKSWNMEQFEQNLHQYGCSVYPETAAGLVSVVQMGRLQPGYHAIMDVGGGSTDISFFRLERNRSIKYLASESYLLASNNVYQEYAGREIDMSGLRLVESRVIEMVQNGQYDENEALGDALRKVNNQLNEAIYRLFNKRVYFFHNSMVEQFRNSDIFVYGGGAHLPKINSGQVRIFDNGVKTGLKNITYMHKDLLHELLDQLNSTIKGSYNLEKDIIVLMVCLGLSFVVSDDTSQFFDDTAYHNRSAEFQDTEEMHPFNEGYYLQKVVLRSPLGRW